MSAVPMALASSSSFPAHTLAALGSANSEIQQDSNYPPIKKNNFNSVAGIGTWGDRKL